MACACISMSLSSNINGVCGHREPHAWVMVAMRLRVSKTVRVQRDRIVSLFCLVNLSTHSNLSASTTRTPTTHLPAVLALCFRAADGLNSGPDESSEAACPSGGRRPRSAACIGSDGGVVARSSTTAQHTSNDFASTGERPTKQPHKRLLAS